MTPPIRCFLWLCGFCLFWAAAPVRVARADEYAQVFRGSGFDPTRFRPTGSNVRQAIAVDTRGLRISLRPDHPNSLPVGLTGRPGVRGDFEITMTFHLVQVEKPTSGSGAGVSIWISTTAATQEAATIARVVRPDGRHVFVANRAITPPDGKREYHSATPATAESQGGTLRLVRSGGKLTWLAAGRGQKFAEVFQSDFDAGDLETVRFAAENGGSPTGVDVLIQGVSVRAEDLGPARSPPPPPNRPWGLIIGLAIPVLVGGLWFLRRRSKGTNR